MAARPARSGCARSSARWRCRSAAAIASRNASIMAARVREGPSRRRRSAATQGECSAMSPKAATNSSRHHVHRVEGAEVMAFVRHDESLRRSRGRLAREAGLPAIRSQTHGRVRAPPGSHELRRCQAVSTGSRARRQAAAAPPSVMPVSLPSGMASPLTAWARIWSVCRRRSSSEPRTTPFGGASKPRGSAGRNGT